MNTIADKMWIWGHAAGSHNDLDVYPGITGSVMTPLEACAYLGVKNAFMISFSGNIKPPFDKYSKALESLNEVKWSVVGDGSSPENSDTLGDVDEVIAQSKKFSNITGGIFDDFFNEKRLDIYTPEKLGIIHRKLNRENLDMWGVLYRPELYKPIEKHIQQFDGISFWTFSEKELEGFEENYARFLEITPSKRRMLGLYLYDYGGQRAASKEAVLWQLERYTKALKAGQIEGIIFCSNTVCDLDFEAVQAAKRWIAEHQSETVN